MALSIRNGVSPLALLLALSCETRYPAEQQPPSDGGFSSDGGDVSGGGKASAGGSGTGGEAGTAEEPCDAVVAGGSDAESAGAGGLPAGGTPVGASGGGGGEGCELTYSEGHGDLYVTFDGALGLAIRSTFGTESSEILAGADRVCVIVPAASFALAEAMGGAPDSPDYAFLGVSAGEPFWLLPATPRARMPWFGTSTEEVPLGRYADDEIRLVIAETELPAGGQFAAWSTSTFGAPTVIFSTSARTLTHSFPRGAHVHFNWAFSVPGTYAVTFKVEGNDEDELEESPLAPLRFVVQP